MKFRRLLALALVALLSFGARDALATITVVQSNVVSNPFTGVTSGTATASLSAPVTSGNAVLIAFAGAANAAVITVGTVTDNKSNTYTTLTFDNTSTSGQGFYLATNVTNGPNTSFSAAFTVGTSSPTIVVAVWELSGLAASPTDVATLLSATSFASSFNKAFTTTTANEMGFAILSDGNGTSLSAVTLSNGWSQSVGVANAYLGGSPHSAFGTSSLPTPGSGNSIQGSTASGDTWNISLVTLKPAGGASVTPSLMLRGVGKVLPFAPREPRDPVDSPRWPVFIDRRKAA